MLLFYCRSKKLAKFINRNKQTANSQRARTPVFLVYFLQKAKANNKSVTLRLAPPAFIITNTLCSSPWLCCCFTAGLKSSPNLLMEINKQQTANERGPPECYYKAKRKLSLISGYSSRCCSVAAEFFGFDL